MKKILLLTMVLGLLMSGCATSPTVHANFAVKASSDFNIGIKVYSESIYYPGEIDYDRLKVAGWFPGGYRPKFVRGVLVLADSKILFIVAEQEKYEKVLEMKYDEIADVLVPA